MPVTLVGLVYYLDDPGKNVFRKVYPSADDSELDDPRWVTMGADPSRVAVLRKVAADSPEAAGGMTGTP